MSNSEEILNLFAKFVLLSYLSSRISSLVCILCMNFIFVIISPFLFFRILAISNNWSIASATLVISQMVVFFLQSRYKITLTFFHLRKTLNLNSWFGWNKDVLLMSSKIILFYKYLYLNFMHNLTCFSL